MQQDVAAREVLHQRVSQGVGRKDCVPQTGQRASRSDGHYGHETEPNGDPSIGLCKDRKMSTRLRKPFCGDSAAAAIAE